MDDCSATHLAMKNGSKEDLNKSVAAHVMEEIVGINLDSSVVREGPLTKPFRKSLTESLRPEERHSYPSWRYRRDRAKIRGFLMVFSV